VSLKDRGLPRAGRSRPVAASLDAATDLPGPPVWLVRASRSPELPWACRCRRCGSGNGPSRVAGESWRSCELPMRRGVTIAWVSTQARRALASMAKPRAGGWVRRAAAGRRAAARLLRGVYCSAWLGKVHGRRSTLRYLNVERSAGLEQPSPRRVDGGQPGRRITTRTQRVG
jgi:hypothetical protein